MSTRLRVRRASPADRDTVAEIVTSAFANDPLWRHALARDDARTEHRVEFWRTFVDGALRYPWTWLTEDGEATSVWIPPGETEMNEEQENRLADLADRHLGGSATDFLELMKRFDAAHPRRHPHYYLSLLGTHPAHRGKGVGMTLLAHNLELIDAEGMPAYLESSNPANNRRYESVGFEAIGQFTYPGDGPVVTTMWRAAR